MATVYRTVAERKMTGMSNVDLGLSLTPSFDDLVVVVWCPRRHRQRHPGDVQREDPTGLSDSVDHRTLRHGVGDARPGLCTGPRIKDGPDYLQQMMPLFVFKDSWPSSSPGLNKCDYWM